MLECVNIIDCVWRPECVWDLPVQIDLIEYGSLNVYDEALMNKYKISHISPSGHSN